MNSTFRNTASIAALLVLLMVSLYTIGDATSHSATFGKYYNWLLFFNALGLVVLLSLIVYNVYKLIVQYRLKTIGSHLTARMIGVFVLLTIIPVSVHHPGQRGLLLFAEFFASRHRQLVRRRYRNRARGFAAARPRRHRFAQTRRAEKDACDFL
jgi:hypothetical protein